MALPSAGARRLWVQSHRRGFPTRFRRSAIRSRGAAHAGRARAPSQHLRRAERRTRSARAMRHLCRARRRRRNCARLCSLPSRPDCASLALTLSRYCAEGCWPSKLHLPNWMLIVCSLPSSFCCQPCVVVCRTSFGFPLLRTFTIPDARSTSNQPSTRNVRIRGIIGTSFVASLLRAFCNA